MELHSGDVVLAHANRAELLVRNQLLQTVLRGALAQHIEIAELCFGFDGEGRGKTSGDEIRRVRTIRIPVVAAPVPARLAPSHERNPRGGLGDLWLTPLT